MKKTLLIIPFIVFIILLYYFLDRNELVIYNTSFISIALAIATFSISFSFLQYQFSPYKALLKSISHRHLKFSYLVIFLALIPLGALFIDKSYVPVVSVACIPLLTYFAIVMPIIANEETNPIKILKKTKAIKNLKMFVKIHEQQKKKFDEREDLLDFSRPGESPMHDFDSRYRVASVEQDPFNTINATVELSLKISDTPIYEYSIDAFFLLVDDFLRHDFLQIERGLKHSILKIIGDHFEILVSTVTTTTKSLPLQSLLIYKAGDYLKTKSLNNLQTESPFNRIASIMAFYSCQNFDKNRTTAVYSTSLFRQLAQKGIYSVDYAKDKAMFNHYLTAYPMHIKELGQAAIKSKNSDILFRCLEDLGFLGCTAVKNNHFTVTIECIQGIVQLGREARANNIRCFWRHCALDVVDHADERLHWMVTWLPGLPEKDRLLLSQSFGTAYSRLHGKKISLTFQIIEDKLGVVFNKTDELYSESYAQEGYFRKVDYSDNMEIKEFKIY